MLTPVPTSDCLLAREAASARLDGELSELETARLELHLRDCAACSAYASELDTIAVRLRTAPWSRPSCGDGGRSGDPHVRQPAALAPS